MREWGEDVRLPGRLMLAAGFVGFGLIGLVFNNLIDGLQPVEIAAPWTWANAAAWLIVGLLTAGPTLARRFGHWLALWPLAWAVVVAARLFATPGDATIWVSLVELLGLAAALDLIHRAPARQSARRGLIALIGLMLMVFGLVHWMYVEAIAGMIPAWMPGRAGWPWLTGAANIAAGLALASGVWARTGAMLAGAMFTSWIVLVHGPRLLAAPGDRAEWVGLALAFGLIGVVWSAHAALARPGEDLHPSVR